VSGARERLARRLALGLVALFAVGSTAQAKESYLVILTGLGGEDSYRERFHDWSMKMRQAALDRYGLPADHVFYLGEKPEVAPDAIRAKSTKENVVALFDELAPKVRPGDQLFVLLIGHGSFGDEEGRFNLPGPDLTATDFQALLRPFDQQQIVFVNVASASGSFLAPLAGTNRVIVTATKTGMERNETQFGEYFVDAYAGEGADTDKNGRVSVLEAFDYARLQVDRYYDEENLLKTEHALLDDNGDGEGVTEPGESEGDYAGSAYLLGTAPVAEGVAPEDVAADPELARLVEQKQDLEGRVEALKLSKEGMPEELYMQELESLLLELARVSQQIEERAKP
jgi:hypothetical protein